MRARSTGLAASDVDDALTRRRSVLVSWLHRGTLHLVPAVDYWWLHPLTTPQLAAGSARRLAQLGVSPEQADRGVEVVGEAVGAGPCTREQLRGLLDAAGVPTAGQALVHVLHAAALRGDLVRGPVVDGEQALVSARSWLGDPPDPLEPAEALARLARRYLAGHGPAGPRDLATWAGTTLGAARRALAAVADETEPVTGGPPEVVDLAGREPCPDLPPPRLLGPFDPLLHGWASRAELVGGHAGVVTSNGIFRPTALVDGRVVATWRVSDGTLSPLEPLSDEVLEALAAEQDDVRRFLAS